MNEAPEKIRAWISRGLKRWDDGKGQTQYVRADLVIEALRGAVEAMDMCNVGNNVSGMNRLIAAREALAKAEGED